MVWKLAPNPVRCRNLTVVKNVKGIAKGPVNMPWRLRWLCLEKGITGLKDLTHLTHLT